MQLYNCSWEYLHSGFSLKCLVSLTEGETYIPNVPLFHIRILFLAYGSSQLCKGVYRFVGMFLILVFTVVSAVRRCSFVYTWVFPKVAVL